MRRSLLGAGLLALASAVCACAVGSSGDYDGVTFAPSATAFALVDRNELIEREGALTAVELPDAAKTLSVVLTGVVANPHDDWRRATSQVLLRLRRDLALRDGVIVTGLPLVEARGGKSFEVDIDPNAVPDDTAPPSFGVAVVVAPPSASSVSEQGLGAHLDVRVSFSKVDLEGNAVTGEVEIKRARAEGQDGSVATGDVTLSFSTSILPERLGESNLGVVQPVMECAAAAGPSRAGSCRNVEPTPYIDETGVVAGR